MREYEREFEQLTPNVREETIEIMSDWERKGMEQGMIQGFAKGIDQGKGELLARMIRKRFGIVSLDLLASLEQLSSEELDELSEDFLDFTNVQELERWLKES
jgi:hypothetical protein